MNAPKLSDSDVERLSEWLLYLADRWEAVAVSGDRSTRANQERISRALTLRFVEGELRNAPDDNPDPDGMLAAIFGQPI